MGRIVAQVEIRNPAAAHAAITCSAFVDTGAGAMILPMAWKDRFGRFESEEKVEFLLANNEVVSGIACGPAGIRIEGFRRIYNEAMFMEMDPDDEGEYQPLLGYVILQQAQVAVDMVGHRLVPVKYIDCKIARSNAPRPQDA